MSGHFHALVAVARGKSSQHELNGRLSGFHICLDPSVKRDGMSEAHLVRSREHLPL